MNTYYINLGENRAEARARLILSGWEELEPIDGRFHQHRISLGEETERVATLGDDGIVELEVIKQ